MLKRCIMIFPKFENVKIIDGIRDKYDPLAKNVRPHITLVFPFKSDIETGDLKKHISSVVSEIKPFEVILQGITPVKSFGNYLFLGIQKGNDKIIKLHEKLYTGILEVHYPEWLKCGNFLPHMTVGCLDDNEIFKIATNDTKNIDNCFKTVVNEVSVEIIDENQDSIIELKIPLKITE
ncbi:2'-5' RNA ligase family protein [Clostridium gasigenes]|uniref:2'-5' RNA ligase family protein n=1 Tax=Clostridium gasigenes TaxID=94869 RepID=UPI0014382CFB|nr:2'-5' RNA ligase family protein [Clostridium gasigenes]NKF05722.1 2'-5' RNA ligase family protein [Clostridium gasigenes]QSW19155.1 2'-5' RNA ligase family protein [Clostridium gasigenes]